MAVTRFLILAVLGAALVAVGVGLVYLPAGLIAAGGELIAAAYVGVYLHRGAVQ